MTTGKLTHRTGQEVFRQKIRTKLLPLKDLTKWRGIIPLTAFLVLTIPTGLYLAFNVPAMWAPDGGAHVARVFQIAEGGIRPLYINHEHGVGYGGDIPLNVNELKTIELNLVSNSGVPGSERQTKLLTAQDRRTIAQISSQKISKQRILISFVNTAAYSPIAYLPNVVGVVIGKTLNLSLGHTLLLSGLCGFLTYILCTSYALFTLKKSQLKWVVMTVALLPLTVFQTTLITADSFLMSVSILFSALIIKGIISHSKMTKLDKILLFGCVLALPLVKSVYFPLIFLVLLIPKSQWSKRSIYWLWTSIGLALSTIAFVIWSGLTADVAASNGLVRGDMLWQYGDAKIQEKFILRHPIGLLHAIVDTLIYQGKFITDTYFSWLSFTYLPIPGLAQVAGFMALGLSILLAGKTKVQKYISRVLAGSLLIVVLLIFTLFYIAFTLPMNSIVEGVQGRYFLPLTPLILAALVVSFPKLRITDAGLDNAKLILISLSAFCLVFSVIRYGLAISV